MRGPVPDRESNLARPRHRKGGEQQQVTKGQMLPVTEHEADQSWHPIAIELFEALKVSGQKNFYQESDWAFAKSLCDDLSYYKKASKRSGQMLQTIYSAFERLLVTEGDRRRVRIELQEPEKKDDAAVLAIADYQKDLGVEEDDEDD